MADMLRSAALAMEMFAQELVWTPGWLKNTNLVFVWAEGACKRCFDWDTFEIFDVLYEAACVYNLFVCDV